MADEQTTSRGSRAGTSEVLHYLPAAILIVVLAAFAIDNRHKVTVGFVFTDAKVPLSLVLLATAVIGALVGALMRWRRK